MAYCFMTTEKIKTIGAFVGKTRHNLRTSDVPNADPERKHLNHELIALPEGKTFADAYKKRIEDTGCAVRKDSVKGIEVLMTYGSTYIQSDAEREIWEKENVRWLKDTFGEENVVSAITHMDETVPHIHAIIIPVVDGRLSARSFLNGKAQLAKLQDSYAEYMKPLGLERGLKGSISSHTSMRKFYDMMNKECRKELPPAGIDELAIDYRIKAQAAYADMNMKNFREQQDLKRKIDEVKTISIQEKTSFYKEKAEFEEAQREFEHKGKVLEAKVKMSDRMDEVMWAIQHNYPNELEAQELKRAMMEASQWTRANRDKTKEQGKGGKEKEETK